jgi:hypothetical protein
MDTDSLVHQDFQSHLTVLYHELFDANVHFHLVNSIRQAVANHQLEIGHSPTFWGYTISAHVSTSISLLCRAYDSDKRAVHLRSLLEMVRDNPQVFCPDGLRQRLGQQSGSEHLVVEWGEPDAAKIATDLTFLDGRAGVIVKKLKVWRNNVAAHTNRDASLDLEAFNKQWALNREDMEKLIAEGFSILNRCGSWYKATTYSRLPCSRGEKDYLHVIDALSQTANSRKNLYDLISQYKDY